MQPAITAEPAVAQSPSAGNTKQILSPENIAIIAIPLSHVLIATASGFGLLFWSIVSDEEFAYVALNIYALFSMPLCFLVSMWFAQHIPSLKNNLLSGTATVSS